MDNLRWLILPKGVIMGNWGAIKVKILSNMAIGVFIRPGVAGAVLQTHLWLIKRLSHPFVQTSSKHLLSQTIRARDLTFLHNVHHPLCVTWHVSYVTCHMSGVRCHMSGVTCQVSHVTSNSQTVRARELKFWEKVCLLPPVTCYMTCIMCHMSSVMCHM